MSNEGEEGRPLAPKSMEDLLKITLKLSDQELKRWDSEFTEMDPQRRQWLEEALSSYCCNETRRLIEGVSTLAAKLPCESQDADAQDACVSAFDSLCELVERIDHANDFIKVNGVPVLLRYLSSPSSELRWRAAELVAHCAHNNVVCQSVFIAAGTLLTLRDLAASDEVAKVRMKSISAISALVSNYDEGVKVFEECNCVTVIVDRLRDNSEAVRLRSAFLLKHLLDRYPQLCSEGQFWLIAECVVLRLGESADVSDEHFVGLLLTVVLKSDVIKQRLKSSFPDLKQRLTSRLEVLGRSEDRFLEEVMYCRDLFAACFSDAA